MLRVFPLILLLLPSCTTNIIPPPAPTDPITLHLLDHGRHPSLIIPLADGTSVRYAYGDWSWYALGHTGVIQAIDAILLPSHGALGRKILATPEDFANRRRRDPAENIYTITVERARADVLRHTLDQAFQNRKSEAHFNEDYDLEFVPSPHNYWAFHNCNQVMANWLRALGCRVRGPAIFSVWQVESPPSSAK